MKLRGATATPAAREKSFGIDLGLAVLSCLPCPPEGRLQREIAEVCGCDRRSIAYIEERALRKIAPRLVGVLEQSPYARAIRHAWTNPQTPTVGGENGI